MTTIITVFGSATIAIGLALQGGLTNMVGGQSSVGGIAIMIVGNAVIIVLEGMIVAIQVIRLQYYEFFSKFFQETGREFVPFKFKNN